MIALPEKVTAEHVWVATYIACIEKGSSVIESEKWASLAAHHFTYYTDEKEKERYRRANL